MPPVLIPSSPFISGSTMYNQLTKQKDQSHKQCRTIFGLSCIHAPVLKVPHGTGSVEVAQQRVWRLLGACLCVHSAAEEQRGVLARQPHSHEAHQHCLHCNTAHTSGRFSYPADASLECSNQSSCCCTLCMPCNACCTMLSYCCIVFSLGAHFIVWTLHDMIWAS